MRPAWSISVRIKIGPQISVYPAIVRDTEQLPSGKIFFVKKESAICLIYWRAIGKPVPDLSLRFNE